MFHFSIFFLFKYEFYLKLHFLFANLTIILFELYDLHDSFDNNASFC